MYLCSERTATSVADKTRKAAAAKPQRPNASFVQSLKKAESLFLREKLSFRQK
jgi:hypothetical protein